MESLPDNQNNSQRRLKSKRWNVKGHLLNVSYILIFIIRILAYVVGLALSLGLILWIAELIFPKYIRFFNYKMTDHVFTEMVKDKKYNAAIKLMELNPEILEKSSDFFRFRQELADCYIETGDYPNALRQYRLLRQQIDSMAIHDKPEKMSDKEFRTIMKMIDVSFLKEEARIYLKMGDIPGIKQFLNTLNETQSKVDWDLLNTMLQDSDVEEAADFFRSHSFEDGFKYELIQGTYLTDPQEGINQMEDYALKVANSHDYNPRYQLKMFNALIGMLIEQGQTISARHYLEFALQLAHSFEYNSAVYDQFGDLSEYCYQLNDIENGRKFSKYYLKFIDDSYNKEQINYATGHALELKYLLAEGKIDDLIKSFSDISETLRKQISKNFTGMTSAQREYFVSQFMPVLTFGNSLLESVSSDKLSTTVFENNMFLRGLLLRSENTLAAAIEDMNDQDLSDKYKTYQKLSEELVARQYMSGIGNAYKKNQLENDIEELEKEITSISMDFRRNHEKNIFTISDLKKHLSSEDLALQFIKGKNKYFAQILDKSGKITSIPLGSIENIEENLNDRISLYTDPDNSSFLKELIPVIKGKNIYYTTDGTFNQIALGALPINSSNQNLNDICELMLVSSVVDIPEIKKGKNTFDLQKHNTMLWGGIVYGDTIIELPKAERSIERGELLSYLRGSEQEVKELSGLLTQAGLKNRMIMGKLATEKSFTDRSHKKDYILHVSTHGFFHDNGVFTNPMQNAGLLFSGSQPYWETDSVVTALQEKDGILRADEISTMDLNGCRLVVLSACQTGLGESNSEGVFGLQRAFKLAGVDNILMSLWSVDDVATKELMKLFYSELIAGNEPNTALKNAQNKLRNQGYAPSQWAPFILLN